jgi:hypothetical protein
VPLVELLENYLPTLPLRGVAGYGCPLLSAAGRQLLHDAVDERDRVAQGPAHDTTVTWLRIHELLDLVQHLLYVYDWHCGHIWAFEHAWRAAHGPWFELAPAQDHHVMLQTQGSPS